MGLTISPDVHQEIMENIFRNIEECDIFIDDIGNFSSFWEEHIILLKKVVTLL